MSTIGEELERLASLLEKDLVTRAEFDQQKVRLLDRAHSEAKKGVPPPWSVTRDTSGEERGELPEPALSAVATPSKAPSGGGGCALVWLLACLVALAGLVVWVGAQEGGWLDEMREDATSSGSTSRQLHGGELCAWKALAGYNGQEQFGQCAAGLTCWGNKERMNHAGMPGYAYRCQ